MKTIDDVMLQLIDDGYVIKNEQWADLMEIYDEMNLQHDRWGNPIPDEHRMQIIYLSIKRLFDEYIEK